MFRSPSSPNIIWIHDICGFQSEFWCLILGKFVTLAAMSNLIKIAMLGSYPYTVLNSDQDLLWKHPVH